MRHDQQAMIEISIFCAFRKLIPDMMVMKNTKVLKPKIAIIHHLPLPERHQGHWNGATSIILFVIVISAT